MAEIIGELARGDGHGLAAVPAALCAKTLGVTGLTVSVLRQGAAAELIWSTDEPSALLDDLHLTLGEGPAADVASFGELILEPDLGAVQAARWPVFTPAALDLGVRAIFAVPLQIGVIRLGVLLAHRDVAGPLGDQELADVLALAGAVTSSILGPAVDLANVPRWVSDQLAGYSAQIHQATGMVSVQLGVDQAEALIRLRAYAFSQRLALADVASAVVARRLRFSKHDD